MTADCYQLEDGTWVTTLADGTWVRCAPPPASVQTAGLGLDPTWLLAPWGKAYSALTGPSQPGGGGASPGGQPPAPPAWSTNALVTLAVVALAGGAVTYYAYQRGGSSTAVPVGALSVAALGLGYVAASPPTEAPKTGLLGSLQTNVSELSQIGKTLAVALPLVAAVGIYAAAGVAKENVRTFAPVARNVATRALLTA